MAAPVYRSTSSIAGRGGTELTLVRPSRVTLGDILIAQSYTRGSGSIFLWPTGWTEIFSKQIGEFSVGLAWVRWDNNVVPSLVFGLGSGTPSASRNTWVGAIHAISGAASIGNPLDQLGGTEYVTASTSTSAQNWQPPYTPTTDDAETLAMSIVFTTDNNRLRLLPGSEQGFRQRWTLASTSGADHASALATRRLTSPSTPAMPTMPTSQQVTLYPEEWAGVFIALTATDRPPPAASYLIRALP